MKSLRLLPFLLIFTGFALAQSAKDLNISQSEMIEIESRINSLSVDELNERKAFLLNEVKDLEEEQQETQNPSRNKEISSNLKLNFAELNLIEALLTILVPAVFIDTLSDDGSSSKPIDNTAPIITILGDNPVSVELGTTYIDAGAISDNGQAVTSTSTVDTTTVGTYTVTYSATDASGNTGTATRTDRKSVV